MKDSGFIGELADPQRLEEVWRELAPQVSGIHGWGQRLRFIRKGLGLARNRAATMAGVKESQLRWWEQGGEPPLAALAQVLRRWGAPVEVRALISVP